MIYIMYICMFALGCALGILQMRLTRVMIAQPSPGRIAVLSMLKIFLWIGSMTCVALLKISGLIAFVVGVTVWAIIAAVAQWRTLQKEA